MVINSQFTSPIIKFYSSEPVNGVLNKNCYFTFSANTDYLTSRNLLSYSFDKNVRNLSGTFNISIKEDLLVTAYNNFFDKINLLDVVVIYEDGKGIKPAFYGVIENISIGATAETNQKTIQISGSSIDSLFQKLEISVDVTAMAIFGKSKTVDELNLTLKTDLASKGGTEKIKVSEALKKVYDYFVKIANELSGISNTVIADLIKLWYGDSIFDVPEDLTYGYPISSNFYSDQTVNVYSFFQNLMPEQVYEFYGSIDDKGKPVITVRESPFDEANWKTPLLGKSFAESKRLPITKISSEVLTDYTFSISGQEVYNVFMSFVVGHTPSIAYVQKTQAGEEGYANIAKSDAEKIAKWGYKPMICNFIGFSCAENKKDEKQTEINVGNELDKLNNRMAVWYGHLDETFNGSLSVLVVKGYSYPKIGERLQIANGQFYVTTEHHSWSYGKSIHIQYSCERGGKYDSDGKFNRLSGLSLARVETRG